jgi:hypothetical protein
MNNHTGNNKINNWQIRCSQNEWHENAIFGRLWVGPYRPHVGHNFLTTRR